MDRLPVFEPCDELIAAQKIQFNDESLIHINAHFRDYLQTRTLSIDNLDGVFKILLTIEDLTCTLEYTKLALNDTVVNYDERTHVYSVCLNKKGANAENIIEPLLDQVVIIPKASLLADGPIKDEIKSYFQHAHEKTYDVSTYRPVATVGEVSRKEVEFEFEDFEPDDVEPANFKLDCTRRYNVIFRSVRVPERLQYRALELFAKNEKVRQYIFPNVNPNKTSPVFPTLNLINPTIAKNKEQLQAVCHIVEGPNAYAPYIIFGPPGTGKTTTIVEAILQLRLQRPGSRILVTAGSNSACDTIALRICEYFDSNPKLVQYNATLIRYYSMTFYRKKGKLIPKRLLKNCNYLHKESGKSLKMNAVAPFQIVVATLCSVGVLGIMGLANSFTHVFIDEAGASSEPETLVGIVNTKFNDNCRIILSGDHKQLGPVIKSNRAAQLGLGQSMMERLLKRDCYALDANGNYDQTLQTRLRRNYRSHPEIVRLYNHLYYDNELIAEAPLAEVNMAAEWHILPEPSFPIIFQAAHGKFTRSNSSPSSFNLLEVEQVKWYLWVLLRFGINGKRVRASDIGIISPYRAQCEHITKAISGKFFRGVEVGSVETFQGREKHIVIVSFVRSYTTLGFVSNPRRLNVILSRPKSLLILIGNPRTLNQNDDFNFLIDECIQKGTFLCKKNDRASKTMVTLMQALEIATKQVTSEPTRSNVETPETSNRRAKNRSRKVDNSSAKAVTKVAAQQNKQIKREVMEANSAGDNENKIVLTKQTTNKQIEVAVDAVQQLSEAQGTIKLEDAYNEIAETKEGKLPLDGQAFDNCLLNQQKIKQEIIDLEEQSVTTDEIIKPELALAVQEGNPNDGDSVVVQTTANVDRLHKLFNEQAQIVENIKGVIFATNEEMLLAAELGLDLNQLKILETCAASYTNEQPNDVTARLETKCPEPIELDEITNLLDYIIENKRTINDLQKTIAQLQSKCCIELATATKNVNQRTYTRAELMCFNQKFQGNNNNEDLATQSNAVDTVSNMVHAPLTILLENAEKNHALQNILSACDQLCPIYNYFRIKLCCAKLELFALR